MKKMLFIMVMLMISISLFAQIMAPSQIVEVDFVTRKWIKFISALIPFVSIIVLRKSIRTDYSYPILFQLLIIITILFVPPYLSRNFSFSPEVVFGSILFLLGSMFAVVITKSYKCNDFRRQIFANYYCLFNTVLLSFCCFATKGKLLYIFVPAVIGLVVGWVITSLKVFLEWISDYLEDIKIMKDNSYFNQYLF